MEFAISEPKIVQYRHKMKSKHIDWILGLKCDHCFDLGHDLDFWLFKVSYGICYILAKMVRLPWNKKQTYGLNSRPQMWPLGLTLAMTLTSKVQGQIGNLLYLGQKWSDCLETKSKHIDQTLGLKCDRWVWPSPWTWPWLFKVNYGIWYILGENDPIAKKMNVLIEH